MIDKKNILSEISNLKKNMKSENGDYLSGYFSALSTIEGMIAGQDKIGGWIFCNNGENLPKEAENNIKNGWSKDIRPTDYILCETTDGNIFKGFYSYVHKTWTDFKECHEYETHEVIRWRMLPEPYKPD